MFSLPGLTKVFTLAALQARVGSVLSCTTSSMSVTGSYLGETFYQCPFLNIYGNSSKVRLSDIKIDSQDCQKDNRMYSKIYTGWWKGKPFFFVLKKHLKSQKSHKKVECLIISWLGHFDILLSFLVILSLSQDVRMKGNAPKGTTSFKKNKEHC